MKLVEEGKLNLDAEAFKILSIQPPPGGRVRDPRIWNVTIRELLEHSGGWDRDKSFDPMFASTRVASRGRSNSCELRDRDTLHDDNAA